MINRHSPPINQYYQVPSPILIPYNRPLLISPPPVFNSALSSSPPSELITQYQQEIEKLKKDKKYSDFYITATAAIGVLSSIGAFMARRATSTRIE